MRERQFEIRLFRLFEGTPVVETALGRRFRLGPDCRQCDLTSSNPYCCFSTLHDGYSSLLAPFRSNSGNHCVDFTAIHLKDHGNGNSFQLNKSAISHHEVITIISDHILVLVAFRSSRAMYMYRYVGADRCQISNSHKMKGHIPASAIPN